MSHGARRPDEEVAGILLLERVVLLVDVLGRSRPNCCRKVSRINVEVFRLSVKVENGFVNTGWKR